MWCDRCRSDVAAEVVAATGRAGCATCGSDLGPVRRVATDEARELLRKWSADGDGATRAEAVADPVPFAEAADGPGGSAPVAEPAFRRARVRRSSVPEAAAAAPRRRVASAHARPPEIAPRAMASTRLDKPHSGGASPPHFDVHTAVATRAEGGRQGSQVAGQILAYAGVLALTLGTALVIWGYFGGPADYAPTGWLIATGGQMLLFLGVVTLIAGGLEQTSQDVRVRVESLGERLIRIEQAATGHALRGPHVPAEAFDDEPIVRPRRSRERV